MKALHRNPYSCLDGTRGSLGRGKGFAAASAQNLFLGLLLLSVCAASWGQDQEQNQAETNTQEQAQEEAQAAAAEPPEPPRYSSRLDRDRQLLAEAFPEQVRWLELPGPEGEALALYQPPLTANPKGSLLILHSADRDARWSPYLENLRRALPYRGWGSLSVTLPAPEPEPVPERPASTLPQPAPEREEEAIEEAAEDAEEQDQEAVEESEATEQQADEPEQEPEPEPLPPREERIGNRLDAAMALLDREGQRNLVLLVDSLSAPDVMTYFQAELEQADGQQAPSAGESPLSGPVRALILVNAYPYQALTREQLTQVFAVDSLPVLDVFMGPGKRRQETVKRHRAAASRQQLNHYQHWSLARPEPPDLDSSDNFWINRIQGFMHRQARGVEVSINQP